MLPLLSLGRLTNTSTANHRFLLTVSACRWGHLLRDGELLQAPARRYECNTLILGGGAAGLGALWYLAKHNHRDVLLAEGFERNGNNAA